MKLTKKLEAEILKTYNTVWNAYLKGDMRTFASLLDENCHIIGSAAGEVFSNKKSAVKYYKATAEQITGKAEFRNRKIKMMPVDKGVMVNEELDFYFLIDDQWTFYGYARISSLLHKKNNKWKVIHQHGSFPDSKTEEGEQVNADKIKAENVQLRDAVKRRTIELENKNRELEIESSLERVRAQVMTMHRSEELIEVCKTLLKELQTLGIQNIRNTQIAIANDDKGAYMSYDYYTNDKFYVGELYYNSHPLIKSLAIKMRESKTEFINVSVTGAELDDWRKYLKSLIQRPAPKLDAATSLNYYYYSIGPGGLGFCAYTPLTDEEMSLLKRFKNVFDLAYRRYADVTKAEAQAREAQIEVALERVRARTMAMQHSDELKQAATLLFQQVKALGVPAYSCGYNIWEKDEKVFTSWMSTQDGSDINGIPNIPLTEDANFIRFVESKQNGEPFFVLELRGERMQKHYQYLKTIPAFKAYFDYAVSVGFDLPQTQIHHIANFSQGNLLFITLEPCPEFHDVFKRFAAVFDQTYTRFLDLQKAEAQAREAKIETALERVRARTMAMQKSDELPETSYLLFQQLKELGETAAQLSIGIIKEEKGFVELSATLHGSQLLQTYDVPMDEPFVMKKALKAWKAKERSLVIELKGNELKDYNNWRNSFLGKKIVFPEEQWIINIVYFSKGFLSFSSDKQIPEETFQLLERFAGVFDQTYTRFLDLQKAEAQAREAKIEAVLERVRSRTMAMQKSDELTDVAGLLFEQVDALGIKTWTTGFNVWNEDNNSYVDYITSPNGGFIEPYTVHTETAEALTDISDARKSGVEFDVQYVEGEKIKQLYSALTRLGEKQFEIMLKDGIRFPSHQYEHFVFGSKVSLMFITYEPVPEAHDIFKRLGKVFEQTYTRFLDLKKAEAQSREAQIELALERVRARTMAMHKSDELAETAQVMFQQLSELGGIPDRIAIGTADEEEGVVNYWATDQSGRHIDKKFKARLDERTVLSKTYKAWKDQKRSLVIDLHGDDMIEWVKFAREEMGVVVRDEFIKDRRVHSFAFFSHGWILVTTHELQSADTIQILERFALVFNLTYRRFLDLEKAEAQAREAQIEAALEKVRASAMAMHKSDDLNGAVTIMFEEFQKLNLDVLRCGIGILNKDSKTGAVWATSVSQNGLAVQISANESFDTHELMMRIYECWQKQEDLDYVLQGQDLINYYKAMDASELKLPKSQLFFSGDELQAQYYYAAMFNAGGLYAFRDKPFAAEDRKIMKRFASVVNLTYNRFLDLQKAEAQAREAQIEAALERVRSKAMAMHSSKDLAEAIGVFYRELKSLSVIPIRCGVALMDKETRLAELTTMNTTEQGDSIEIIGKIKMAEHPVLDEVFENWLVQKEYHAVLRGNQIKEYYQVLKPQISYPDYSHDEVQFGYYFMFKEGDVYAWTETELPEDDLAIYRRFTSVISLTYKRYKDLKQAEAQAKEARIEAALERVRSKTMAMHNSQDVGDTVATMFDELVKLNIETVRCGIAIIDESKKMEVWTASSKDDGSVKLIIGKLDMRTHPLFMGVYNAWKNKEPVTTYELIGEDLKDYFRAINNSPDYPIRYDIETLPYKQSNTAFMFPEGSLFVFSGEPLTTEASQIFKRFAGVFGQTYRRYLDLQKAEAQAKEARIETALEKVRSSTMAMHHSEELKEVISVTFEQLKSLNIPIDSCIITLFIEGSDDLNNWVASAEQKYPHKVRVPYFKHPLFDKIVLAKNKPGSYFTIKLSQKENQVFYKHILENSDFGKIINEDRRKLVMNADSNIMSFANFKHTGLRIGNFRDHTYTQEENNTILRFANVFEQTYTRFLDLQKAEANAREAQIEGALERVRSKAMAMHKSEDLNSAVATVFEELEKLDLGVLRCGLSVLDKEKRTGDIWVTTITDHGSAVQVSGDESFDIHPLLQGAFDAWLRREDFSYLLEGDDLTRYYKAVQSANFQLPESQMISSETDPIAIGFKRQYCFATTYQSGGLFAFRETEFPEEAKTVMKRFANVFDLTYKRFLDLQKAEANAREATVEASLEKVRGSAMSMHNSNDISATTTVVFEELRKLNIRSKRCGVALLSKDSHTGNIYAAATSADGKFHTLRRSIEMTQHHSQEQQYESWIKQENYIVEMRGEELRSYYQLPFFYSSPDYVPPVNYDKAEYGYYIPFSEGLFYAWTEVPYSNDEINVLNRFNRIVDLTFRRYFDLQKSEANAREAVKQAALDRVRAEIASMRTVDDLNRITPLIWNEFTILGIPFIRCGVFIMDEEQQLIHTFLSTPDGKAIAAFHMGYDTPGSIQQVLINWHNKKKYVDHWNEEAFTEFAGTLIKQGVLTSPEQYLKTIPQGGFYLHFLPFLQGMLYVGNTTQLKEEEIELIQHVAEAFSTAYARYEDFNKLEAAKQQVENTLTDLKQAQTQLVQAEKMASLGELTAGIAHEIQNPLNFVNNFSEVSKELLDEMKIELDSGNTIDAKGIADDVIQNLEKINHHGKRADAIVKSMLQHSRSSSGKKEPTDINGLADEYLRLAYHGLRAKDKSFNAKFETEFDNSIGKINVISQDIGRVLVNLINNAFYAVSEKKKKETNGYEPTVTVLTKKTDDKIEIKVKDNGNGIPQKVLDKIFQPFFTTKPTGQGTGLGLSLSYDIIKAHGGELKVNTTEGDGAEFIIQIPMN